MPEDDLPVPRPNRPRVPPSAADDAAWESKSSKASDTGAGRSSFTAGPLETSDGALFEGVLLRRVFAFLVDAVILSMVGFVGWLVLGTLVVLSFGLLSPILALLAVIPIAYHTLFVAARGATVGMKLLDLEVLGPDGHHPDFVRALVLTVLFYFSLIPPAFLVLLVPLFNSERRTLHDWLTGCCMQRTSVGSVR